jgi:hypothetical protein
VTEHVEFEDLYEKEFDDMEGLEVYGYMEIETENMRAETADEYMGVGNYKRVEDYYIYDDLMDDYEMEWVAVDKEVHRHDYTSHEEEVEEEVEVPRKKDCYKRKKWTYNVESYVDYMYDNAVVDLKEVN